MSGFFYGRDKKKSRELFLIVNAKTENSIKIGIHTLAGSLNSNVKKGFR